MVSGPLVLAELPLSLVVETKWDSSVRRNKMSQAMVIRLGDYDSQPAFQYYACGKEISNESDEEMLLRFVRALCQVW